MAAFAELAVGRPRHLVLLGSEGDQLGGRAVKKQVEIPSSRRPLAALDDDGGLESGNRRHQPHPVATDGLRVSLSPGLLLEDGN